MRLPRLDRRHAVLAAILISFGVISVAVRGSGAGGDEDPEGIPSVEHRGKAGLRGLFLACGALGLPVEACHRSPLRLGVECPALVVIGGGSEQPADRAALAEWIEQGGRLVVGDVDPAGEGNAGMFARTVRLPRAEGVRPGDGAEGWALPAALPPATRVLDPESIPGDATVIAWAGAGADARPWIASYASGDGRVTVLAEAGFLTNEGIEHPGGAVLAVRLVESLAPGRPVAFLESIHGYEESASLFGGPARMIASTTAGHAALQIGAAALLLLVGGAPRFGRPRRRLFAPRRSGEEHVDAVAGLLAAAGAWEEVGRLCLLGLRRRLGLPPVGSGEAITRDVAVLLAWEDPAQAAALKDALWKIRRGTDSDSMIRALASVEERAARARPGARRSLAGRR